MSGKQYVASMRVRRGAALGVATATVAAVTMTAAPLPPPPVLRPVVSHSIDLAASYNSWWPAQGALPDITGGLGNAVYNGAQNIIDTVLPAIVNAVGLEGIGKGTGLNLTGLINEIPKTLLPQILDALPLNLAPLLRQSLGLVGDALVPLLQGLGIMDNSGNVTLTKLLGLVGIDIDNLFNLGGLAVPGVKIVTAGPVFTLAKMIGIDLGWTPGTANAIAKAVDSTQYLDVSVGSLINTVLDKAKVIPLLAPLIDVLETAVTTIGLPKLDIVGIRVPVTIGLGLGAFSLGQAYNQIVADLANQPNGAHSNGGSLLGGLTIMPEVLLNNLGRANGGLLARFYPIGDLLGINTVTPDVKAVNSGSGLDVLGTGISLGAANLIPVKVDATLEYQPFSDFAAWPDPFTLANNLVAGTLATYLLRGISTNTVTSQIESALGAITGGILSGNPLAANIYLTIPTATLPLLEPLYLAGDVANMVSFGTLGKVFTRLANALSPALSSLVNLGYTDVVRNADGTYTRTLDQGGEVVPFFSFPKVNWSKVPGDIMHDLAVGFQKQFFSNNPTAAPPNIIESVISLLTGGRVNLGVNPLSGPLSAVGKVVSTLVNGLVGTLRGLTARTTSVAALPAANATMVALSATSAATVGNSAKTAKPDKTDSGTKSGKATKKATKKGKHAAPDDAATPADSGKAPKHAAPDTASSSGTKSSDQSTSGTKSGKKGGHDRPSLNVVRGNGGTVSSAGSSGESAGAADSSSSKSSPKSTGKKSDSGAHHRSSGNKKSTNGHAA